MLNSKSKFISLHKYCLLPLFFFFFGTRISLSLSLSSHHEDLFRKRRQAIALKNGLLRQRGEYISRLKQIRVAFEKQRQDTNEETLQLQQTLKMLRDEFVKTEEANTKTRKELESSKQEASQYKQEAESLREIMGAMGEELKMMRKRIQELHTSSSSSFCDDTTLKKILTVSRPPASSIDVKCKTTTIHVSRQGSIGILDDNKTEKENRKMIRLGDLPKGEEEENDDDDDDDVAVEKFLDEVQELQPQKPESDAPRHKPSLIGSALLGLGNLWSSSSSNNLDDKGSPKRRSRRRSVSDPRSSSPRETSLDIPEKEAPEILELKSRIKTLTRQLSTMKNEQADLDINHRCEVKSLKDIVKAMSSEIDNVRSEKKLLLEEKNRLLESMSK